MTSTFIKMKAPMLKPFLATAKPLPLTMKALVLGSMGFALGGCVASEPAATSTSSAPSSSSLVASSALVSSSSQSSSTHSSSSVAVSSVVVSSARSSSSAVMSSSSQAAPAVILKGCSDAVVCDDFEPMPTQGLDAMWQANGVTVVKKTTPNGQYVAKAIANIGATAALHLSANVYPVALGQQMYGRILVNTALAEGQAAALVNLYGATATTPWFSLAQSAKGLSVSASNTCNLQSNLALPNNQWVCLEWHVDTQAKDWQIHVNGEEIPLLSASQCVQGGSTPPAIKALAVGLLTPVVAANNTVFIDDFKLDTKPVGCPSGLPVIPVVAPMPAQTLAGALPLTHTPKVRNGCESLTWEQHGYAMCRDKKVAFPAARKDCESMNMQLVRIDTPEENEWVYGTFYGKKTSAGSDNAQMWVGATDNQEEGVWRWLIGGDVFWRGKANGKAQNNLFTYWGRAHATGVQDQPNDSHSAEGEDCMVIRAPSEKESGHWTDIGCGAENNPAVPKARIGWYTCESY